MFSSKLLIAALALFSGSTEANKQQRRFSVVGKLAPIEKDGKYCYTGTYSNGRRTRQLGLWEECIVGSVMEKNNEHATFKVVTKFLPYESAEEPIVTACRVFTQKPQDDGLLEDPFVLVEKCRNKDSAMKVTMNGKVDGIRLKEPELTFDLDYVIKVPNSKFAMDDDEALEASR